MLFRATQDSCQDRVGPGKCKTAVCLQASFGLIGCLWGVCTFEKALQTLQDFADCRIHGVLQTAVVMRISKMMIKMVLIYDDTDDCDDYNSDADDDDNEGVEMRVASVTS